MFRTSRTVAGVLLALLALSAVLAGVGESPAPKKLTLVYNVNNAGYIDVCGCKHKEVRQGSITRRSSFLKQLRATGRNLLLLDGGSSLFALDDRLKDAERIEAIRKADLIVEAYNRMEYRAIAIGSFDLAAGLDALLELEKKAKFDFLSANLVSRSTRQPIFKPHAVYEVAGVRVGVIGLTLNTMDKVYLGKVAPDAEVTDPIAAAEASMNELRGKTDLIIALSHLRQETNTALIKKLKDLEILVDPFIEYGNHHTWIQEDQWVRFEGETLVLRSDGQGARMGVVDFNITIPHKQFVSEDRLTEIKEAIADGSATAEDKTELAASQGKNTFTFQRISLEPHHRTDPDIDTMIDEWKKNVDPAKVARQAAGLPRKADYLTVEKCSSCHQKQYEFWKTTKHSHAMASLAETGDQHRYDCVGCHSLGYGEAFLDTTKIGAFADVQCESCHGTNPKHAEKPQEMKFSKVSRSDCIVCHNKEQLRTEFNFVEAKPRVQCPKG